MLRGFVLVLISSLLFGTAPSFSKLVLNKGVSPAVVMVYYTGIAALLNGVSGFRDPRAFRADRRSLFRLALVGVIGSGMTSYLLSSAYTFIPVGFATVTHFLYPVVVTAALSLVFHQHFGPQQAGACTCALVGMSLIIPLSGSGHIAGFLLAFCSSCTYAFYIIACSHMDFGGLSASGRLFWINLFSFPVFLALSLATGSSLALPDAASTLILCGCGAAVFLAHRCFLYGIDAVGAAPAAFTSMMEPITSLFVSSVLLDGTALSLKNLAGVGLILIAMLLVSVERRHARST